MSDLNNPMGLNAKGPEVKKLQATLRALGLLIDPLKELSEMSFGVGTRDALLGFQKTQGINETGVLDDATQAKLEKATRAMGGKCCIVGRVTGLPTGKVELQLYRHVFDQKPLLLGKTTVQEGGYYALDYDIPDLKKTNLKSTLPLNIELMAVYLEGKKKIRLSLSGVKYNADRYEVLNLTAPVGDHPAKTDHDKLMGALLPYIKNANKLKELREDQKRKDFTFLSKSAGVDARQLILASAAAKISEKTGVEPKALYALYQSGISPNEQSLALADPEKVKNALESAVESGIVRLDGTIKDTVKKISEFARVKRPTLSAAGALSSYKELLDISGLAKTEKEAFQEIFFNHQGSTSGMWKAARKKFIAMTPKNNGKKITKQDIEKTVENKIEGLQLQGKLIHLTTGNAPLMKQLQRQIKSTRDLPRLADEGYDKPEKWEGLIQNELLKEEEHKGKKMEDFIPPAYTGKTPKERLQAYTTDMAQMVRTSFPLQAVRRKIRDKELELVAVEGKEENDEIVKHVMDFLNKAENLGFELGETALGRFFKENEKALFRIPMNARLKTKLVREAEENLNRVGAKSFILRNWKRAFEGIPATEMKQNNSKIALMKILRSQDFHGLPLADLLNKTIHQEGFRQVVGAGVADKILQNLAGILKKEKGLLPQKVEGTFKRKVKEAVKTLIRLQQVSPDDDGLQVLYKVGVKSAQGITAFSSEAFCDAYAREALKLKSFKQKKIPEKEIRKAAKQIHQKAWLIHSTALNVVVAAGQIIGSSVRKISGDRSDNKEIDVASISARPAEKRKLEMRSSAGTLSVEEDRHLAAMKNLIAQYPTMEELLGSTDYCECQECQSVLGPAAYLVDLFRFLEHIDPNPYDALDESWSTFIQRWKEKHHGAPYPFKSPERLAQWSAENPGQTPFLEKRPYEILLKHRPDLPHLPLTCENTNTVLPYIDLVNEILEYYILNPGTADEEEESLFENFVRYDTGKMTSADLLAEPQNILPEAYEKLRNACYPLILPFDLWLETIRLFFNHFDKRLWEVLETFRSVDELELFPPEAPDTGRPPYYRAQIFSEYLGISPKEYELFTNSSVHEWYELYGYSSSDEAKNSLKSAKTLSRRLGVTYKELVDIIKTRFVNPGLKDLGFVWKLGIEIADAVEYFEKRGTPGYAADEEAFENKLTEVQEKYRDYFHDTTARDEWESLWPEKFRKTLVLRDRPKPGETSRVVRCDFERTYLEYASVPRGSEPAAAIPDLIRINLFVRLWRKLGWTIEETDWALTALWPNANVMEEMGTPTDEGEITDRWSALADRFKTVLVYLAHLKYLEEKLKPGRGGRQKLLTLWAEMPSYGEKSLYSQLFLGPTLVKNDPDADTVFDDPFEKYLTNSDIKLVKQLTGAGDGAAGTDNRYLSVLQGALGLTDSEIRLIISDAHSRPLEDADDILVEETLSLANVSLLYRYGLLAKSLKLSVKDLITLNALSGLNPFTSLETDSIATLGQDHPYNQTIRFVEIAGKIKESGFKIEDLDFLLRHRFDPVGKYRAVMDALPTFLGRLASGIRDIGKELSSWVSLPPSDDLMREKIALLLPADSADEFSKIISGTMEFEAVIPPEGDNISPTVSESIMLESADFAQVPEVRVAYDPVRQAQHLFYKGFLTEARKSQILQFFADESPGKAELVKSLLEQVRTNAGSSVAQRLLELMATMEFSAAKKVVPANMLPAGNFSDFPIRLSYDVENQIQHFSYTGLLTSEIKQRIIASLGAASDVAQSDLLQELLEKVGTAGRGIFDPLFKSCMGKVFSTVEFEVAVDGAVLDTTTLDGLAKEEPAISGVYLEEGTPPIQHLVYKGLLNNDEKERIIDRLLGDSNLRRLLEEVQIQQLELIRYFQTDFLDGSTSGTDLAGFPAPEEKSRTELAMSLLPFLLKRSRSDFIIGMFATDTGADPSMIKDLLSEPTLLSDPLTIQELEQESDFVHTDRPLMEAFAEAGQEGADTVFTTPGGDDEILMTSINTSAQKEDGTPFRPEGAGAVRFEGWLKVPTDGIYRFFAIRDSNGVEAEFRLGDLPDPVIQMIAEEGGNEATGLVKLKGGIPYQFSFEARKLLDEDGNKFDVRLEIVGETLSRQDLGSLVLYPAKAVERVRRARILAIKTLQTIKTLGLSGRETAFLLGHRALFDNLDFGILALHDAQLELEKIARKKQAEAEAAGGVPLPWVDAISSARNENRKLAHEADLPPKFFKALLRLLEYASLKKELSPDSDDLISVMEKAGRTYFKYENPEWTDSDKVKDAHFNQVAALMGRVAKAVREAAEGLKFTVPDPVPTEDGNGWRMETPDLRTEKGIRRLWEALQIVEIFGLSANDLRDAAGIVAGDSDGFKVALNLRNAIKARYETEDWRKIVKDISDELRRRKRDALVACITGMHPEIFTMREKLFEWFLVDPGMEPVVKTSRIRMALESVRRFIQRCLDGKETWVSPSAINKEQWKVRGRFRFWQANRRIFLHPENWLEPEFRDDKSHLYQELEGTLLQGDVSDELVEDVFFKYLKGLEEISRLEIMTVYQETEDDPHEGWLHVIGRTPTLPHKYFYRQYDGSEWTPWEPIDAEIEGDNVVAIVWKQRLHLLWVTFMEKSAEPESKGTGESVEDMAKTKNPQITKKRIEAQLNWTDYFEGQWRSRQASEYMDAIPGVDVASHNPDGTFVYAAKERTGDVEGPVQIHYHLAFKKILSSEMEGERKKVRVPAKVYDWLTLCQKYYVKNCFADQDGSVWADVDGFGLLPVRLDTDRPHGDDSDFYVEVPEHDAIQGYDSEYYEEETPSYKIYSTSPKDNDYYGAFRLLNKNCPPEIVVGGSYPWTAYSFNNRKGSRFWGKGALRQKFFKGAILWNEHTLPRLTSEYRISLAIPDYPYESMERSLWHFLKPFFYQDGLNVFFVQPFVMKNLRHVQGWGGRESEGKQPEYKMLQTHLVGKVI